MIQGLALKLDVMIMSGVEDGLMLSFNSEHNDGYQENGEWILTIGRREDSDIPLRNDTYISRLHARLHWSANCWWLEDCESKNGTFVDEGDDDTRVHGTVEVEPGQLFRIGRTWLRLQITE